jgi:hypothetical protein
MDWLFHRKEILTRIIIDDIVFIPDRPLNRGYGLRKPVNIHVACFSMCNLFISLRLKDSF